MVLSITTIIVRDVKIRLVQTAVAALTFAGNDMTPTKQKISFADFSRQATWLGQQIFISLWSERLRWSGLEIVDDELMTRTRSPNPHRELHNILVTRIRQSTLSRDLDRCLAILAAEAQPTRWFLNAQNQESEITEQLIARGFDDFTSFSILASDLSVTSSLHDELETPTSRDGIIELNDEHGLKQWVHVLGSTHDFSTDFGHTWLDMLVSCGIGGQIPWRYYLCYADGLPVGALSALWTEQVATIEVLGVKKAYRKHGIGSALITRALNDAKQAGYEVAVSCPIEAAQDIYAHYGFTKLSSIDCVTIDSAQAERYKNTNATERSAQKNHPAEVPDLSFSRPLDQ